MYWCAVKNLHTHSLTHVATIPWEIKNSNFLQIFNRYGRKWKQIAFSSPLTLFHTLNSSRKLFENHLRFDKVTDSLKVGTVFETQCICEANRDQMRFSSVSIMYLSLINKQECQHHRHYHISNYHHMAVHCVLQISRSPDRVCSY